MKKAPAEREGEAETFVPMPLPETCAPPPRILNLPHPSQGPKSLPLICEQRQEKFSSLNPTKDRKDLWKEIKENLGRNPNVCTIYFLSMLHKSSQFIIFGTKTCVQYNLICLLNYQVCYILEKSKQTKRNYFPSNNFQRIFFLYQTLIWTGHSATKAILLLKQILGNWGVSSQVTRHWPAVPVGGQA